MSLLNSEHISLLAKNCSYSFAEANYTKKIENMFSEVKQQLVELKEEIKQMKGNQTGRPCKKGL